MPHVKKVDEILENAPPEKRGMIRQLLRKQGMSKDVTDHNQDMEERDELEDEDLNHEQRREFVFGEDFPTNPLRNIQLPPNTVV